MARGGKRSGAGRKPGSKNKRQLVRSAVILAAGDQPLDIMLTAARNLLAAGENEAAASAAAKAAPYVHNRLAPTPELAERHPAQKIQDELFPFDQLPASGAATAEPAPPDDWEGLLH